MWLFRGYLQNVKTLLYVGLALFFCCYWLIYRHHDRILANWNLMKLSGKEPINPSVIHAPNSGLVDPVMSNDETFALYNARLLKKEASCEKIETIGLEGGGKDICLTTNYRPKPPCLVYSFGIARDFTFDRAMVSRFGCEVFAFDPSIGVSNQTVTKNLHFYSIGVAGSNIDDYLAPNGTYSDGKTKWKLRTLKSLIHEMKHQNRIIDILKMDIEEWEFEVLEESLSSGVLSSVKQLTVEFHVFRDEMKKRYKRHLTMLLNLFKAGFRIVFNSKNKCTESYCHQADIIFVNRNFEKN